MRRIILFLFFVYRQVLCKLCVATMIQNQQAFIRPWMEYHRKVLKVDYFMFFDDLCTDGSLSEELANSPNVILAKANRSVGNLRQATGLTTARDVFRDLNCTWLGNFDVDEWFAPMKLTKDPAADYEPMADVLDGLPGDVAAVLYSHADHTIHHVQSEDPSVYCPAFPRGSTMLDPDFQVCRARGGTTKWFMRIEPFIAPRVHTVVVNASAPGGRDMRPFYSYKLPGVRDYALIHFKYPCFDNWLQKGVPGGRLGLKDWNVDMSNATEQVRGRVPVKLMFCLPSSPVAVERATAAIETMRRLFQPMKRVLMQTRNPEICDHGSPALCDPRYFWQCRCRADTCLRDDFGRELPIPHICSVSCCEDPGPWRHVRGGSRNTAGAADRRTSILRRPAG